MSSSELRTAQARLSTAVTRADRGRSRSAPPAPLVLDRYRLTRRLGGGAFGTVWMARDERLQRDVAVKILAAERVLGGRFEREARAAARLAHPAIVTLYEAAVDDAGAYLVSELVVGSTLDQLLAEGRLSDRDVVDIAVVLCDALAHAHQQGVVHRDVKPSNILVPETPVSCAQVAKLTDFGVARVVGGDSLTRTGDVLGTLAYMAPEQAEGLEAGPAADLYSLALVIYEALSGVNPVAAGATRRSRRLGAYLPPLRRQRRDLPRVLGQSIDLALRPRPRERGSVALLRQALEAARDHLGDEPGVVTGPWTTIRETAEAGVVTGVWTAVRDSADPPSDPPHRRTADEPVPGPALSRHWPDRGLAAVGAAAVAAWLAATALAPAPVAPALIGFLAGGLTLVAPRLGWAAITTALCTAAAAQHREGAALVILIGLLAPVALLPRRPTLWPVAAGAPALGLIGLAGAWPAIAGRAGTAWRRAAVGALGWMWLLAAAAIAARVLYLPRIPGAPSPGVWAGSLPETVHHLLPAAFSAGAVAPALVWALAAVAVPWLVRGRSAAVDLVRVVAWAAIVVPATGVAIAATHGASRVGAAPDAVIGAMAGAALALAPLAMKLWREALRLGGSRAIVS